MEILFDISSLEEKLKELESKTTDAKYWEDSEHSSVILKQINDIKSKTESYKKIESTLEYIMELNELISEEFKDNEDESSDLNDEIKEVISTTNKLEKDVEKLEISTLLSGKYDSNNAILTLHQGAGGTEAQDWVAMLYRMYCRWANSKGFTVKELDYLDCQRIIKSESLKLIEL